MLAFLEGLESGDDLAIWQTQDVDVDIYKTVLTIPEFSLYKPVSIF